MTEKNSTIAGYEFVADKSTINGETEVAKDDTSAIELTDVYKKTTSEPYDGPKGNLDITTKIRGDVTPEDVEKTLKFEVTTIVNDEDGNPVTKWLDKDGNLQDEKTEFTLRDGFVTTDGGRTYTKSFNGVPIGKYVIKETETNIDGFDFQNDSSVTISEAEVVENETAHLNLEDEYVKAEPTSTATPAETTKPTKETKEPTKATTQKKATTQSKDKPGRGTGTGDDTPLGIVLALMFASLAGIGGVSIYSRRRNAR